MNSRSKIGLTMSLVAALALGGCWDDDDDESTGATTEVPDSAGTSGASFIAYLLALDRTDESNEPSIIRDGFAVPADETSEPMPLT